jgi:hypothetical protein
MRFLPHCALLLIATTSTRADVVEVKMTREAKQFCHIVRFTKDWGKHWPPWDFTYYDDYEFRAQGTLGTTFLVRGYPEYYKPHTPNLYEIDLSDPKAIARPATEQAWEAATRMPLLRRSTFPRGSYLSREQRIQFNGLQFSKTGDLWALSGDAVRLSPDQTWIVLQSYSGSVARTEDVPFGRSRGVTRGTLFFDVFNAVAGNKLLTLEGTYRDIHPTDALIEPAWLTERYFIIPLGNRRERSLVCQFDRPQGGPR